jgi:hypothetical protein
MKMALGLAGGLALTAALALTSTTASAADWCGFHRKEGARVQCGFSSLQECKQALSEKASGKKEAGTAITCRPDPASG